MRTMTAYAYVRKVKKNSRLEIVAKSFNSKYLDIAIYHLPPEKVILERKIRELIEKNFSRGRIEMYIFVKSENTLQPAINEKVLKSYYHQINKVVNQLGLEYSVDVVELLSLPGVISLRKEVDKDEWIIAGVKEAIKKIKSFRQKQGRAVKKKILNYLKKMENIVERIKKVKVEIKEKEIGKEDIEEEITLFSFYLKKLKKLLSLKKEVPIGKEMDFIIQEILRELNASLSKVRKKRLVSFIIEAKNYAERIRQQAQNIE